MYRRYTVSIYMHLLTLNYTELNQNNASVYRISSLYNNLNVKMPLFEYLNALHLMYLVY